MWGKTPTSKWQWKPLVIRLPLLGFWLLIFVDILHPALDREAPIFLPIKLVGHYFKPVWFEILKAGFHLGVLSGNLLHSY
jgi:hypothetical protein